MGELHKRAIQRDTFTKFDLKLEIIDNSVYHTNNAANDDKTATSSPDYESGIKYASN